VVNISQVDSSGWIRVAAQRDRPARQSSRARRQVGRLGAWMRGRWRRWRVALGAGPPMMGSCCCCGWSERATVMRCRHLQPTINLWLVCSLMFVSFW